MHNVYVCHLLAYRVVLLVKHGDADGGHEAIAGELFLALGVLLQNFRNTLRYRPKLI